MTGILLASAFYIYPGFISHSPLSSPGQIVVSGWEIYTQISAMNFYPYGLKSTVQEFSYPNTLSAQMWKVDPDTPHGGVPNVMVQTSTIRHVDGFGRVIPLSEAAYNRDPIIRGDGTYYLNDHIYMFDVTIRTEADRVIVGQTSLSGGSPVFAHETSWAYFSDEGLGFVNKQFGQHTGEVGTSFEGGVYVNFAISPWTGISAVDVPDGQVVIDAWAGIMSVEIFQKNSGSVANVDGEIPNASQDALQYAKAGLDNGASVPMYADDGTYGVTEYEAIAWNPTLNPSSRIRSSVVLYLPVDLTAGAQIDRNWYGAVTNIKPCDVYVSYTVMVEVLTSHKLILQTAINPPTLAPPVDYLPNLSTFDIMTILVIVLVIIAVIVGVWLVLKLVRRGFFPKIF